jgi:hypothetical protein
MVNATNISGKAAADVADTPRMHINTTVVTNAAGRLISSSRLVGVLAVAFGGNRDGSDE